MVRAACPAPSFCASVQSAVVAMYNPILSRHYGKAQHRIGRKEWMDQKGMTVFSLFSPDHPVTEIDLFVDPPLVFEEAYSRAVHLEVAPGINATFCSIDDLIDLKSKAGRPRDLDDISQLIKIRDSRR